ncbi:rCG50155 [Rattus norvegicus]|uniref:RCG50155 n=1 Tax=Rattus norvegicus TaxID=10116 RepID=A6JYX2_RAT|nr:rCG50155 [Rattus norvegicus]
MLEHGDCSDHCLGARHVDLVLTTLAGFQASGSRSSKRTAVQNVGQSTDVGMHSPRLSPQATVCSLCDLMQTREPCFHIFK